MKWILGAMAALGVLALSTRMGRAEDQAAPTTFKVAVVNLSTVFQQYEKANRLKAELAASLLPANKEFEGLQQQIANLKKKLPETPTQEPLAAQIRAEIAKKTKEIEALQKSAGESVKQRVEQQLVQMWKEINATVDAMARKHGFSLVLAFGDPSDKEIEQIGLFPNANRRMQAIEQGAMNPLFIHPSIDVTAAVLHQLNEADRKARDGRSEPKRPAAP